MKILPFRQRTTAGLRRAVKSAFFTAYFIDIINVKSCCPFMGARMHGFNRRSLTCGYENIVFYAKDDRRFAT
jgi:hypothetical protein